MKKDLLQKNKPTTAAFTDRRKASADFKTKNAGEHPSKYSRPEPANRLSPEEVEQVRAILLDGSTKGNNSPTINLYDTLALDLSGSPLLIDKYYFRLEQSKMQVEPTSWVSLNATNASLLFFIALNRLDSPGDNHFLIHPEENPELLLQIRKKFQNFLKGPLKKELFGQGDQKKKPHSWVLGSGTTRSKYAQRIHEAFTQATKIQKLSGYRQGPLLYTCESDTEQGGFHLAPHIRQIIQRIPQE